MKRMKKFIPLLFCFMYICIPLKIEASDEEPIEAHETEEDLRDDMIDDLSVDALDQYWSQLYYDYEEFLTDVPTKSIKEMIRDNDSISITSMLKGVGQYLFYEVTMQAKLLGTLIMLTLFSIILQAISAAFERNTVSQTAHYIIFIVLLYITLMSFHEVFLYAQETIESMSNFLIALLPLMLGLIATFGQVLSVSFFHPIIIFLIHVSGLLMTSFVFPLLFLSALLMIVSHMNEKYQATYLADLFKHISLGTLGVFITVFLGVISIQGTATAIQDGVALKTTKFITGNFVPVIGRSFTEAADTVLSAALLLKNAIGIFGLIIIISIAVFPLVKITVIALMYKLAAALLQPLGNNSITICLNMISKYMMYILACLIIVTFMFFLAIVLIIVASNIPFLFR